MRGGKGDVCPRDEGLLYVSMQKFFVGTCGGVSLLCADGESCHATLATVVSQV
jgi:hypothetical protein